MINIDNVCLQMMKLSIV